MATLVFHTSDGREQKKELRGELSVGREAGNDVVLGEQGVSRSHCKFYLDDAGKAWVEDLNSANGVLVDGQRIGSPTQLSEGVEVVIGPARAVLQGDRRPSGAVPKRPSQRLPAKADGSGKVKSTRMVAAAEARRPAGSRPPPRASEGRPRLKGVGAFSGNNFDLDRPRSVVGRVPPAEIVVDDDSISRRHAELVRSGNGVSVRDMGSANGTFVNGERISDAPLSPGDVVRFGIAEFNYLGPGLAQGGLDPKKKKLLIIGGAGVGLLLIVVVMAMMGKGDDGEQYGYVPPVAKAPEEDPVKLLGRCKSYSDPDTESLDWAKALEACSKAVELDPSLTEARSIARQAKKELENEQLLKNVKIKIATSQEEAAIQMMVTIERTSTSYNPARKMLKEAADRVVKRKKTECKTEWRAGSSGTAYEACKRYVDVSSCFSDMTIDSDPVTILKRAGGQLGRPTTYACPPELEAFLGKVVATTDDTGDKAVIGKYPDGAVQQVMLRYFNNGRPKQAADELKRMRVRQAGRYKSTLDDLISRLEIIDGRYTSGQEGLLRNSPKETLVYWKDAFEADAVIMPPKVISYQIKDMKKQLAAAFYKSGKDDLNKQRFRNAFESLYEGYQLDPSNTDLLTLITSMDKEAKRVLADQNCEMAAYAFSITLPASETHKRAAQMKIDLGCP